MQAQQQRPESPTVTLTWHVCKRKVHVINSTRGTSSLTLRSLFSTGEKTLGRGAGGGGGNAPPPPTPHLIKLCLRSSRPQHNAPPINHLLFFCFFSSASWHKQKHVLKEKKTLHSVLHLYSNLCPHVIHLSLCKACMHATYREREMVGGGGGGGEGIVYLACYQLSILHSSEEVWWYKFTYLKHAINADLNQ